MSRAVFFLSIAFIGGVFVYSVFLRKETAGLEFGEYVGKEVVIEGRITKDPQAREFNQHLVVQPKGFKHSVLLSTERFSSFQYGDQVVAQGVLEEPPVFDDFNYKGFLETKGIGALMRNPSVEVMSRGEYEGLGPALLARVLDVKGKFRSVIFQNTSPPLSIVLQALLLGDQGKMSNELKDKLNRTGLRHVIAISGQHIVILTNMLFPFLLGLGLWKRQAIGGAFVFMVFFVVLTGAEASAVRSGLMGGIVLLAQYLGRMPDSLRAITFAASLMLLHNPLLLTRDVGFQLSFLATLGIILLYPWFRLKLSRVPETLGVRDILAMDFAAQVFTLPVLAFNFGYVSLVGIFANILVLPVVPLLLGLGFLFLLAGSLFGFLGMIMVLPVALLGNYLLLVMEFFAAFPFAVLVL